VYSLPVLVYHHINNLGEDITEDQFEAQMHYLATQGYRTVFLKDWIRGAITPDGTTVALTFDDGCLDNWVYAYPIIKKYGLKATFFVSSARPRDDLLRRSNLEDVWSGRCGKEDVPEITPGWEANRKCVLHKEGSADFLTWKEMEELEASGYIDIQSHSHYHRDFFISNQIVDFNQNTYFGVGWATDGDTRYGIPIYPRKSAMMARRYFDDPGLRDFMAQAVGGSEYFARRSKREYMGDLLKYVTNYKKHHKLRDRFETKEEQEDRILSELLLSKRTIQDRLRKTCDLICWPWGEYSNLSIQLARQAGYRGAVSFSPGVNLQGTEAGIWHIKRFPPPRNLEDFARAVSRFSSSKRSQLFRLQHFIRSKTTKIDRRARQGEIIATMRRKLVGLLKG
jgi:peptidoglycan/xylan/chitin deacetylase (PgdA/CDA1 family)